MFSLQADLWLFLGKSSKPPLLPSPPLGIIREYIPFFNYYFLLCIRSCPSQPCKKGRSRSSGAALLPRWPAARRARGAGDTCAREGEHDPIGLSHRPGGFAPTRDGAWTTACCCCCYFLSVFLDINTSSLHPQDGFQAPILFPMATKTQPGNLSPLAR